MFWKNVTSVLTGTVIAQAIPIIGSLAIARLYSIEDFGLYSAWLGIVLILSVVFTARYELAIAVVEKGKKRALALWATLYSILAFSLISSVALFIFSKFDILSVNVFDVKMLVLLIPTAMAMALSQTIQSLMAANGDYKSLSIYRVKQAVFYVSPQVIVGLWYNSSVYLMFAHFVGVMLVAIITLLFLDEFKQTGITNKKLIYFYKRYNKFPIYSLPGGTMNSISAQLPVIAVTAKFGAEAGGVLALTMRTLGAPISILGKSILDVFKKYASDEYRLNGSCNKIYMNTFYYLSFSALVFSIFLFFFSEILFVTLFGDEWIESGKIAILLLPLFALRFIASPLSYLIFIVEKQQVALVWQSVLLVMTLIVFYSNLSFVDMIFFYSLGYAGLYLIYIRLTYLMSLPKCKAIP